MYALSRPDAVESGMSDAAVNRTSTGKLSRNPFSSTMLTTRSSASRHASRGMAYSISVNFTCRGLAKTLYDVSTYSVLPVPGTSVESLGIHDDRRFPAFTTAPKARFSSNHLSRISRHRLRPPTGSVVTLFRLVSAHRV